MINKKNLSDKSVAFLPKLILLLGAVMPVAENKDELYYTCAISSIVAFLLYVAIIVTMLRHSKDRKRPLYIFGITRMREWTSHSYR